VVAVSKIVSGLGIKGAIGFDMGGTSTDVSRFEGELEKIYEKKLGGIDIQMEMMNLITVASGGGSVLWFDGGKMRVGPKSSGAYPGPACYGFGGPLSVTDANLITGRLCPEHFPKTFGINRDSSLDMEIAHKKFNILVNEINSATGQDLSIQGAATGFIRIANETMAMAIKEISVSRGFDVRDYALVCFGGAGGQHACRVASLLGIKKILFHPLASLMSAYGIGLSRPARKSAKTILRPYNKNTHDELTPVFKDLEASLSEEKEDGRHAVHKELDLRFKGTDSYITIPYKTFEENLRAFKKKHEALFGFYSEETHLEVVNLRLEMEEETGFFPFFKAMDEAVIKDAVPESFHKIFYPRGKMDAPVYLRKKLPAGERIKGPALLVDGHSTLVIDIGFEGKAEKSGIITVEPVPDENSRETQPFMPINKISEGPDPVMLEVFNNLFMGIAIEMGSALKNTAHSVNIKERQDFSCAVFDENGDLVANAPHIPVHLGSMADTVKAIIEKFRDSARPDDLYLTNNPYGGGSHLPDMTVVCPVFSSKGKIIFFTASRGHHADIGGITPGSMPPVAYKIEDEGVLIDGFLLSRDGVFRERGLIKLLSSHTHPARNLSERISDIKAQIASCRKGVKELKEVIERYGWGTVRNYMGFIQENAAHSVRLALGGFLEKGRPFTCSFKDQLDDGTSIMVKISIKGNPEFPDGVKAVIDFSGTDPQHRLDNLNAPLSVTRSAVIYVLRAITGMDIPLNSGCLKPIELIVPEKTILNPQYPCPVASGNVETSQRVVDVLLGALGMAAASQGTMNNLLFEIEGDTPYYETIAGGAGAMLGCPGASGIQVHMTNTRITDPEVLETRHEGLLLKQFRLRKGSGGKGLYPGGDGVVREIKFLKPATVSIISERRKEAPYGLSGGESGKKGENILKAKDGQLKKLPHRVSLKVDAEESIIIKTPGGGGAGRGKMTKKAD
jgi:5-oxoprolinase (ATP-hydrolysing)